MPSIELQHEQMESLRRFIFLGIYIIGWTENFSAY